MSIGNIEDIEWEATTISTMTKVIIYDDIPRPSFWRHPIKWWRWERKIIGFIDLDELIPDEHDSILEVYFDGNEGIISANKSGQVWAINHRWRGYIPE